MYRELGHSDRSEDRDRAHAPIAGAVCPVLSLRRGDGTPLLIGGGQTRVMGVLNLTPDSFSDGGQHLDPERALSRARELVRQGADLIDLGAESTRPGAAEVPPEEEWRRLAPVLLPLVAARPVAVVSVDTRHIETARRAAQAGARLLNLTFPDEFLPGRADPAEARELLARFDGVVLMHARGTPATMRALCHYDGDVAEVVVRELSALRGLLGGEELGARLIFDPGLGFAKRPEQSLRLLARTAWLRQALGRPLLVGASRKSFLGEISGLPVAERLAPSLAAALLAAQQGADIVRVHDVLETRAALAVLAGSRKAGAA